MAENGIAQTIKASLENIREMVDANTVVGTPISTANGTTLIPISKLSIGFASGGVEYLGKNASAAPAPANKSTTNFGGGGGTGLTVTPVAFIIIKPNGDVEMQNINGIAAAASDPVSQISALIDRSPEIITGIKAAFTKKPKTAAEDEADVGTTEADVTKTE